MKKFEKKVEKPEKKWKKVKKGNQKWKQIEKEIEKIWKLWNFFFFQFKFLNPKSGKKILRFLKKYLKNKKKIEKKL